MRVVDFDIRYIEIPHDDIPMPDDGVIVCLLPVGLDDDMWAVITGSNFALSGKILGHFYDKDLAMLFAKAYVDHVVISKRMEYDMKGEN